MHKSLPVIPFTKEAYQKLQEQLKELLQEEKELLVRIQVAREMGDLSENGAYKYGKIELGNVRRVMKQVKYQLTYGKVTTKKHVDFIQFGHTITLKNDKSELKFMLVSEFESDPIQNKLSTKSPIGEAAKGKRVGDVFTVKLPKGEVTYTVVSVT